MAWSCLKATLCMNCNTALVNLAAGSIWRKSPSKCICHSTNLWNSDGWCFEQTSCSSPPLTTRRSCASHANQLQMRLMDCREGNSSLSLLCRDLWELKSFRAKTCVQVGHTWQSSSAAASAPVDAPWLALFFLFLFLRPMSVFFSGSLKSLWAVRSSCCLLMSGNSTSSSLNMKLKLSPSSSLQLWWYWVADIAPLAGGGEGVKEWKRIRHHVSGGMQQNDLWSHDFRSKVQRKIRGVCG